MEQTKQGHNFTKISDEDLIIGYEYCKMLGPLLYNRVLKTKEFMKRSGYKHGIKSFRKLISRFKRQGLIGTISQNRFSEQYIFPKEKLIKFYKGDNWKDFVLQDESLKGVKTYEKLNQVMKAFELSKKFSDGESYINSDQVHFDFRANFHLGCPMSFGVYAFFEEDEDKLFDRIDKFSKENDFSAAIILTTSDDKKMQTELLEHYFPDNGEIRPKVAWCYIEGDSLSQEEILKAPLSIFELDMNLQEFVEDGIYQVNRKIHATEERINNPTF